MFFLREDMFEPDRGIPLWLRSGDAEVGGLKGQASLSESKKIYTEPAITKFV